MNCLYTTLLGTDDYLYGVIGLYRSLMNSGIQYGFKAIVPDNIKPETIAILDECQVPYEVVVNTPFTMSGIENAFWCTLNKYQFLQWTDYDKIMFLDADILVLQNPDSLFDFSELGAASVYNLEDEIQSYKASAMILPSSAHLWQELKKLQNSLTITDDDRVLNFIIAPQISMACFTDYPYFLHDCFYGNKKSEFKYWQRFNLNTVTKLNAFIDNITDYVVAAERTINSNPIIITEQARSLDDVIVNIETTDYPTPPRYIFIGTPE